MIRHWKELSASGTPERSQETVSYHTSRQLLDYSLGVGNSSRRCDSLATVQYAPAYYILDAGLKVMFRVGYQAATVRDICAAAGAPHGSFTNHFRSKEAFAREVP
jgi:hypothetical protein